MSDIAAAVRARLLLVSGVTDLVSTRIYFDNLPQGATLPALTVERAGEEPTRSLTAASSLTRVTTLVTVYAASHTSAASVGDAVHAALEMQSGTWNSVTIRRALVTGTNDIIESPQDGSDAYRHVRIMTLGVWAA